MSTQRIFCAFWASAAMVEDGPAVPTVARIKLDRVARQMGARVVDGTVVETQRWPFVWVEATDDAGEPIADMAACPEGTTPEGFRFRFEADTTPVHQPLCTDVHDPNTSECTR